MKLFIACMSSPVQVIQALQSEAGLTKEDIFIHPLNVRLADRPDLKAEAKRARVTVIMGYQDMISQLSLFNMYPKTVILLAPVLHALRLHGETVEFLDTTPAEITPSQVHRFRSLDRNRLQVHDFSANYLEDENFVVTTGEDYLPKLIDAVRSGSLLNNLMTTIYRIGKAATQKMVKNACVRWMVEDGQDWNLLTKMLDHCGLSEQSVQRVSDVIRNDGAQHLAIIDQLRKTKAGKEEDGTLKVDTQALAKKHPDFDAYELRYILKIYAGLPYDQHIAGKTLKEIYYGRERNKAKAAPHHATN